MADYYSFPWRCDQWDSGGRRYAKRANRSFNHPARPRWTQRYVFRQHRPGRYGSLLGEHSDWSYWGHRQGPEVFVFEIWSYSKLFFYNPVEGNLLLDVRVFQGSTYTNL